MQACTARLKVRIRTWHEVGAIELDISSIIFIVMIAVFAYRGYGHGLIEALSRVGGILAGYAMAIWAGPSVALWLEQNTLISGVLAFVLTPPLLLMSTFWAVDLIFDAVEQAYGHHVEDTRLSHYGGLVVGAMLGVVLAVVSIWLYVLVRDALLARPSLQPFQPNDSAIEGAIGRAVGGASHLAMGRFNLQGAAAVRAAKFMAQPALVIRQIQALWGNIPLRYMLQAQALKPVFVNRNLAVLQRQDSFQELLHDRSLQQFLIEMQLVDPNNDYRRALAYKLMQLWIWIEAVKDDPVVLAILADKSLHEAVDSNNPTQLLLHPGLLKLLRQALSEREERVPLLSADMTAGLPRSQPTKEPITRL